MHYFINVFHCTICISLTFGGTPDESFPEEGLGQSLVLSVCSFLGLIHQLINKKIILQNILVCKSDMAGLLKT